MFRSLARGRSSRLTLPRLMRRLACACADQRSTHAYAKELGDITCPATGKQPEELRCFLVPPARPRVRGRRAGELRSSGQVRCLARRLASSVCRWWRRGWPAVVYFPIQPMARGGNQKKPKKQSENFLGTTTRESDLDAPVVLACDMDIATLVAMVWVCVGPDRPGSSRARGTSGAPTMVGTHLGTRSRGRCPQAAGHAGFRGHAHGHRAALRRYPRVALDAHGAAAPPTRMGQRSALLNDANRQPTRSSRAAGPSGSSCSARRSGVAGMAGPCDSCATWSASAHAARRQQCAERPHPAGQDVRGASSPSTLPHAAAGVGLMCTGTTALHTPLECFDAVHRKNREPGPQDWQGCPGCPVSRRRCHCRP